MLMQKRALASTSSGQASQLKRPRVDPTNRQWHRSKRNLMLSSWLIEKVVQRVVREEWVRTKSELADLCQSSVGNALKEMMQQISSMKNAVQKPTETVELTNDHSRHLGGVNAKSMGKNDERNLRLQIKTKLSSPLYTGKKLEGEGGASISVDLINANTGHVVKSGPESSIKLDVVVLECDFNKDDENDWAHEEFEKYVVKERERKGQLLTGDLHVTLKEGAGELGELIFTDNSSWNRNKRFRIGLKVASGYCGNTRIREAKTDAFRVKEHRGESNKKHYPPKNVDEVWRLEKIAKDGIIHRKLSEARIHKVEDFLRHMFKDPKKLREVLGKSITPKNWECLVNHAKTCTDWKANSDYTDEIRKDAARQLTGLIEDNVYFGTHQLSAQEKSECVTSIVEINTPISPASVIYRVFFFREPGDIIVKKAFDNWNDVREFNGETFSGSMQEKSSSSFPSQVFEGQIENLIPVQCNLAPQTCATPVGPEAPLANAGSTVEGQSQNTNFGNANEFQVDEIVLPAAHQPISADKNANFGNAMEISVDESVPLASHQPIFADQNANFGNAMMFSSDQPIPADNLNVLISPGDTGIPTVGLPNQSHDTNLQYAMGSQLIDPLSPMASTMNELFLPYEPYIPLSRFRCSSTCPLPEGKQVMQIFQSTMADDTMDSWNDDPSFQTPLWDG